MRQAWNLYPCNDLAGNGVVFLKFVIQLVLPGRIGAENQVISVDACHVAAVASDSKFRIGCFEQKREIRLVGIRHLGMVDDDGTREAVAVRCADRRRQDRRGQRDRGRS